MIRLPGIVIGQAGGYMEVYLGFFIPADSNLVEMIRWQNSEITHSCPLVWMLSDQSPDWTAELIDSGFMTMRSPEPVGDRFFHLELRTSQAEQNVVRWNRASQVAPELFSIDLRIRRALVDLFLHFSVGSD